MSKLVFIFLGALLISHELGGPLTASAKTKKKFKVQGDANLDPTTGDSALAGGVDDLGTGGNVGPRKTGKFGKNAKSKLTRDAALGDESGGDSAGSRDLPAATVSAVEETAAGTESVGPAKPKAPTPAEDPLTTAYTDDIDPKGNCSSEIKAHCKDVTPGPGVFSECITLRVKADKAGNEEGGLAISDECKQDVRAFKIEMYKDISLDKKMEKACNKDISKFCDDDFLYPEPGNIVACLREVNQVDKLAPGCKQEVVRAMTDAAEDLKLDPQLNELCSGEADRLCKGVPPGEGRIQECLRDHRNVLAWDCQAELFRQEVEDADDIRLNVRLFQACMNDKKKFCPDVNYGDARVKDCLESHMLESDFTPRCKVEFEKMMERRATDFRLDANLRKYCKADIAEICYPDAEDMTDVANYDAKVIQCLQDYRDELKDPHCKQQVHILTSRAAMDIRFDKPLADACHADRISICKDVPDGMAQVFLCLQDHTAELKDACRAALFDQLVRMAEDIDFKFPMKVACTQELQRFCTDVTQGHATKVKCLQEKIDDADMGEQCRKEVKRDMIRSAEDYRLNYRLNKACYLEVQKHCLHACDSSLEVGKVTCGGQVLKCLQENTDKLETEACKKEVFTFEKMQSKDILLDVPLQTACKDDLTSLCPDVSKDHSRTLTCLRNKRDKLTPDCKAEEMRFSVMEASDIRLTPTLMNACGQELQAFCKDVPPSEGQAFKCLQMHLGEVGMGAACKGEVNLQEARHASNYRLDVALAKECATDVEANCKGVDEGQEGHALVLKCLVAKRKNLTGSCETEVAYAARSALFQYVRGAEFTKSCDPAVDSLCADVDAKEINGAVIGSYGQCLISQKKAKLPPECKQLVKLAGQEGGHVGGSIDQARLEDTLKKLEELKAAGITGSQIHEHGLILTGWMALAAVASLVVVALGVGYFVYQKYYSPNRNYTLVVKSGDV